MECCYYSSNHIANHIRYPKTCNLCPAKAIQRGVRATPTARYHDTTRCDWDSRMVQQLCISTKTQWKSQAVPVFSEAKSSDFKTGHRGPTLNDIFLKLNNAKYLSLIDVSSGYHNLKLDERSSYLTTFACQFGRCRYKRFSILSSPCKEYVSMKNR